jgi:hypothetical protein
LPTAPFSRRQAYHFGAHREGFPLIKIAPTTRFTDRSSPVPESRPVADAEQSPGQQILITLREELVANQQNPLDLTDDSLFLEAPFTEQRHYNLSPLQSPLFDLSDLPPYSPTTSEQYIATTLPNYDAPDPSNHSSPLTSLSSTTSSEESDSERRPLEQTSMSQAPMPVRGERAAPLFDRSKPRQITRYFEDLELLFKRSAITDEGEQKGFAVRYTDFDTEQLWKTVPEFVDPTKTYQQFKAAILVHYPNAGSNYAYSLRDLDSLTGERYRSGIHSTDDLSDYHMQFMAITNWLIGKNRLAPLEQQRAYIRGFQPSLLTSITNRLQVKFPDQHANEPYQISDVCNAARFILQNSEASEGPHTSISAPRVPTLIAAPTPTPTTEVPIKTEQFGLLISQIAKTIDRLDAISKQGQGGGTMNRSKNCHFCGGAHFVRECQKVEEYITAGKCKRNPEGKVVLPSGIFVTSDIPPGLLKERIDEWHRRYPNQLAADTMLHTVEERATSSSVRQPIYQLTKAERIASLEAELSNLHAVDVSAIRTRAQKNKEPIPVRNETPSAPVRPQAAARSPEPNPPTDEQPVTPEHPFRYAKDAAYIPPIHRNVGNPVKPPFNKKPEPAYRTLPPIHDPMIATNVYKRAMETPITITQKELLSLSPEVRSQVREATTTRRQPTGQPMAQAMVEEIGDESDNEEPSVSTFTMNGTLHRTPPQGATIIPDPIETYLVSLKPGENPDPDMLTVAITTAAIRSIYALVDNSQKRECDLDPGCAIISMSEKTCHELALVYDPSIKIHMRSANGSLDSSLGLARNVPFQVGDITVYLQAHIVRNTAYSILLGRPFDILTESVVRNYANQDQTITITDPNSGRQVTVPTFPKGANKKEEEDF